MLPLRPCTVCETEDRSPAAVANARLPARGDDAGAHHDPGFRWTVLRRHGRRPLAVLGRPLLQANNRCIGLPYWSEISIHETAGRQFAVCLCHAAPGAAGPTWCDTALCESPEAVRAICFAHDPLVAMPSHCFVQRTMPGGPCLSWNGVLPAGSWNGVLPAGVDFAPWDAGAPQRFRGAWAGLLAAVFGLLVETRPHP